MVENSFRRIEKSVMNMKNRRPTPQSAQKCKKGRFECLFSYVIYR